MAKSANDLVAAAKAEVPSISSEEAAALHGRPDTVFLDVREAAEVAKGKIKGAVEVPRGMLEFKADPTMPTREDALDPKKTIIVYCASGGRAALAGQVLHQLGYKDVRNLGGFKSWAEAGHPVE